MFEEALKGLRRRMPRSLSHRVSIFSFKKCLKVSVFDQCVLEFSSVFTGS